LSAISVLLTTFYTYPLQTGGVSTWCHYLCSEMPQVDFTLYVITDGKSLTPMYVTPPNVQKIILSTDLPYEEHHEPRKDPTESVIESEFVPLLRLLLQGIIKPASNFSRYGKVVYDLWQYFQSYHWYQTWESQPARVAFFKEIKELYLDGTADFLPGEIPGTRDMTTAMKKLSCSLLPLSTPVPVTDIVHSTNAGFIGGLPGIIAKYAYGTPYLLTEHGVSLRQNSILIAQQPFSSFVKLFLFRFMKFISRLNYDQADWISTTSQFNRRWEIHLGADPKKIEVIYNGVSSEDFVPKPKPPKTTNRPTVIASANIVFLKDIETLIRAAAVTRETIPNVYYLIYGSHSAEPLYVEKCRKLVNELNLGGTLEFGDFNPQPEEIYNEGDVTVISSLSESCPYALLESMACARPVVSTDVGDVKKILDGCGIVVPPRNHEALGNAVADLLKNDQLRLEWGHKARELILAKYTSTMTTNEMWKLYRRLAAERHPVRIPS
jgi:glycosyltransferase involved in cell wall biosynthesis